MAKKYPSEQELEAQEIRNEERLEKNVFSVEKFFEDNKSLLWTIVIIILIIAAAVLVWHRYIKEPKRLEAEQQMYPAELLFEQSSYKEALQGNGNILGFKQIIDKYGSSADASVYFYAGVCELELNNFKQALAYLNSYNGKNPILKARALACKASAYSGLKQFDAAINAYKQAAKVASNQFAASCLLRAALLCEKTGKRDQAMQMYEEIKNEYPNSIEAYSIEKYIARLKYLPSK